jgi:hypothetical protein
MVPAPPWPGRGRAVPRPGRGRVRFPGLVAARPAGGPSLEQALNQLAAQKPGASGVPVPARVFTGRDGLFYELETGPVAEGGHIGRPGRDRQDRAGRGVRPVAARHRRGGAAGMGIEVVVTETYQSRAGTDRKLRNHIRQIQALGFEVPWPRPRNPYRPDQARSPRPDRVRCRALISAGRFSGSGGRLELTASGESVSGSGGSWSPLFRPVCRDSVVMACWRFQAVARPGSAGSWPVPVPERGAIGSGWPSPVGSGARALRS